MSNSNKAVRYYIDRDGNAPVVRTVPVHRAEQPAHPASDSPGTGNTNLATTHAAEASRRRAARNRLTSLVMASVRRHHHHQS